MVGGYDPNMNDPIVDFLVREAMQQAKIEKVLLFGSRARGDARERSDYDLAVFAPKMSRADWVSWKDFLINTAPTLLALDLVLIEPDMSATLRDNILKEGRVIYAKS